MIEEIISRYNTQLKPSSSPTRLSRDAPPRLPSKKQRSQSLTPNEVNRACQEKCNSADGVIQSPLMTRSAGADTFNTGSSSFSQKKSSTAVTIFDGVLIFELQD